MRLRPLFMLPLLAVAATAMGEEFFLVGAAQRQGQDGAWWNTEVWIVNTTASTGGYATVFLPVGRGNAEALTSEQVLQDLPPGITVYRNDLVPEGGLGTLRIVTTRGVVVASRVFNAAGRGSFGYGLPAFPRAVATARGQIANLIGLRRTPQFRTNLGIFNPTVDNGSVHVRVLEEGGKVVGEQSYGVAPGAYVQLTDVLHSFQVTRAENLRAEVSGTVPFLAYASVIDTRSSAPTLVLPLP